MKRMEKYRQPLLSREEYFSKWDEEELKNLKEKYKEAIYNEYYTKHIVFNRDNFVCQVKGCEFHDSPLTLHHYKHKSNGGETKPRNCVAMCRAHQKKYHSGKVAVEYKDREDLPNHIAGHTQAHDWYVNGRHRYKRKEDGFISKEVIREMKDLRKNNKQHCGIKLTWKQLYYLMRFLFEPEAFGYERT